ncbi:p21-activated protein kinase-interacting protein 1-like [Ostrinia nubilalis]|uniref:p21-activated protein kinase-interacting protein 1-like n=1 Tax=Ostrinia furnacalis TaxID=93504 RepID=UPI00103BC46B|nr:p21-activated protein kinase-interacting protein 1-like [Ostrinia furnacalis]
MDELIVGTYEGFLLGYALKSENEEKKFKQTFATHSHTASVRCVSVAGRFLASGGTDDKIVVIDLKTRKEHTVLMNHDGTVNAVAFTHGATHLVSGSDDGSIIVTRTGNWQIEKIWKKAHGGQPVTAIAVHPSDKLALSIGGDKTLRTWNLIKGRPAFAINLSSKGIVMPTEIKFSPGGDRFSLVHQQCVDLWTLSKAGVEKHISCSSKPTSVQWVTDDRLFVGLENGNIISLTVSDTKAVTFQAHKQRVKSLHYENNTLYSASSSGELKVWFDNESNLLEICSNNAGCRVTCVTLNEQSHLIKKEDQSDDEDEIKKQDNIDESVKSNSDSEAESVTIKQSKRKPGAFVRISYDDETENTKSDEPPSKIFKKRKRNKKNKTKKIGN